jgi:hypothetical protein
MAFGCAQSRVNRFAGATKIKSHDAEKSIRASTKSFRVCAVAQAWAAAEILNWWPAALSLVGQKSPVCERGVNPAKPERQASL